MVERGIGGWVLVVRVQGIICGDDRSVVEARVELEALTIILFADLDCLPLFLVTMKQEMIVGILPCCSCLNIPLNDKLMCLNYLLQGLIKNIVWDISYKRPCPIIN